MNPIILKKSTRKGKKWMVVIPMAQGRSSTVHFGAEGYKDYTQHGDDNRKRNYISRHRKNEDWSPSGMGTAGFWARWLLWNKPTLSQSIQDIERQFLVEIEHREPGLALLRPNSLIQAVRFDRMRWTADQARKWLASHNFHPIKRVDKTVGELRYRLRPPDQFRRYATKQTSEGINFIIGFH
jgi:hypothetical protein